MTCKRVESYFVSQSWCSFLNRGSLERNTYRVQCVAGRAAGLTLSLRRDVHPVLDLHVSAEVPLQVELTGAVRTLEGLAASMEMHVAQQVVHSVEGLATYLGKKNPTNTDSDKE